MDFPSNNDLSVVDEILVADDYISENGLRDNDIPSETNDEDIDARLVEAATIEENYNLDVPKNQENTENFEVGSINSISGYDILSPEDSNEEPLAEYSEYHILASAICNKIHLSVQRWGTSFLVAPDLCLTNLLKSRGYNSAKIPAANLLMRRPPLSDKQMADYDKQLLFAIRSSDLASLKQLQSEGRSMMACNKFGESILHLAARRSAPRVVHFLLSHGGDPRLLDDYGRNPLHDACWRGEPDFEVIMMIMDRDVDLVRVQDVRGATPLNYIRQEYWMQTCAFLYHQREKYWRVETPQTATPAPLSTPMTFSLGKKG